MPLGAGLSLLSSQLVDALEVLGLELLGREESLGRDVGQRQQARTGLRLGALEVAELVVGVADAHGTWTAIDGHIVSFFGDAPTALSDGTYSFTGTIPAILNGEERIDIVVY